MIARSGPPIPCYRSQHGASLCLMSGIKEEKESRTPILCALIFHSIRVNYKNSNNTENTHGNNILMCLKNNAEDELNHLKKKLGNYSGV